MYIDEKTNKESELETLPQHIQDAIQLQKLSAVPVMKPINILFIAEKTAGAKLANWFYREYEDILYYQADGGIGCYIRHSSDPRLAIYDNIYSDSVLSTRSMYEQLNECELNPVERDESDVPICSIITTETGEIDDSRPIREQVNLSAGVYSAFDLIFTLDECKMSYDEIELIDEDNMVEPPKNEFIQFYSESMYDKAVTSDGFSYVQEIYQDMREPADFNYIPNSAYKIQPWIMIATAYAVAQDADDITLTQFKQAKELIFKSLQDIDYKRI